MQMDLQCRNSSPHHFVHAQELDRRADNRFDRRKRNSRKNQMQHTYLNHALGFGLAVALACATAGAHADGTENTLKVGYAHIGFDTKSGDLTGPAGTTPPGIQAAPYALAASSDS
jgi:hypothetical protein